MKWLSVILYTYIDVCVGMCTYMYVYYPVFHALTTSPSDIFSIRRMWQTLTLLTAELIRTRPYPKERYPLHILYILHIATGPVPSTPRYCTGYILTPWLNYVHLFLGELHCWELYQILAHIRIRHLHMGDVQRNFSNIGTLGAEESVLICEASWFQGS